MSTQELITVVALAAGLFLLLVFLRSRRPDKEAAPPLPEEDRKRNEAYDKMLEEKQLSPDPSDALDEPSLGPIEPQDPALWQKRQPACPAPEFPEDPANRPIHLLSAQVQTISPPLSGSDVRCVRFHTEDGRTLEFEVSGQKLDRLAVGASGVLSYRGDAFIHFENH